MVGLTSRMIQPENGRRIALLLGLLATMAPSRGVGAASLQAGGALTFVIASPRSTVRFDARATGHTVHGSTDRVTGEVTFDPDDVGRRAEVAVRVEAAALDTANRSRDKNMRESHLETDKYPWIEFRSSKVEALVPTLREGETQELVVRGRLTLHGVEREIEFPVTAVRKGSELRVTGQTVLRLTDYAIPIPRFLFVKLQDEVKVMFDLVAAPAAR